MARLATFEEFRSYQRKLRDAAGADRRTWLTVCGGTGCGAYGCQRVAAALRDELARQGLTEKIGFRVTGCHGFCERGPIVVVQPAGTFYQRVTVDDVHEIVAGLASGKLVERLLYRDSDGETYTREAEIPFYRHQQRLLLGANPQLAPRRIDDYIAAGGYGALARVLEKYQPEEVITEIANAGLRGRGGGGFSTGKKWASCRKAAGTPKYVVCNADEGDPGAYMDRSVLEGNPHAVIEGMLTGAFAIGAAAGYVYVRAEYPLAVENLFIALDQARGYGLLGENILGSGFNLDIIVCRGGGAFVCGEETALLNSIAGKLGEARPKPPFPAVRGLQDKPTVINNVETWATVPLIMARGADWFSSLGTKTSKGTKIFSLVGKIENTGLVEVPMGMTLRELIYTIGGGIRDGRKFKAVQIGGPSGGCLPEEELGLPVDFESLTEAGLMMGSGGMVVMDEDTCMVDVARYFLSFTVDESCGKCTPCREGVRHMLDILERITAGKGREADLALLEELAAGIKRSSLCGLGQTAPNPVLSTLRYFRDEYLAHIRDKRCPAGVCKALVSYAIDAETCTGCTLCAKQCPAGAITGEAKQPHVLEAEKCIKCGVCYAVCKFGAVKK